MTDWENCRKTGTAKEAEKDENLIESLKKTSLNKIKSSKMLNMTKVTAASKVTLAYDSLRELLQALALFKGYKIYNHACYSAFLNEVIKNSFQGDTFDEIRRERNRINYYGTSISKEDAKRIIEIIEELREDIKEHFENIAS